jgi:hypothetical protein
VIAVTGAAFFSSNWEDINLFMKVVGHEIANQATIVATQMCK